MRRLIKLAAASAIVAAIAGCGRSSSADQGSGAYGESSVVAAAGSGATTPRTSPPATMPSGDPVLDGYPTLVPVTEIDARVAAWVLSFGPADQVVALAPGVYTEYSPYVPDLAEYLYRPTFGDCETRSTYFPDDPGTCWTDVR